MLISADFETDPLAAGWLAEAPEGEPLPAWTDTTARSGCHSLLATHGKWKSPAFPVQPFEYYRLEFWSRAEATEYLAAYFYDEEGTMLEADHYSSVDPSEDWTHNVLCFRAKAGAATARVIFQPWHGQPFFVDDVLVRAVARAEALAWAEEVYAQIPPVRTAAGPVGEGASRSRSLPRTFARLRRGGTLRVVMLGDSIINDIGSSPWDLLVERRYPGARVEVVTSVSGSKGCWYYQEDNRVQPYVLDYRPDLLIIGGLSQRGNLAAIRNLLGQVRERAQPEVLLMTGAFGAKELDPRTPGAQEITDHPDPPAYRVALQQLAAEEGAGFFDLRGAWEQYMRGVEQPYEWFMRDRVHANDRGRALAARLLARFFGAG